MKTKSPRQIIYSIETANEPLLPELKCIQWSIIKSDKIKTLSFFDFLIIAINDISSIVSKQKYLAHCNATILIYYTNPVPAQTIAETARLGFSNIYTIECDLETELAKIGGTIQTNTIEKLAISKGGILTMKIQYPNKQLELSPTTKTFLGIKNQISTINTLTERVHPTDLAYLLKSLQQVCKTENQMILEFRIADNNNKYHWITLTARHITASRCTIGYAKIIEKEKKLEEKLIQKAIEQLKSKENIRKVQQITNVGLWRLDMKLNIFSWTSEMSQIFDLPTNTGIDIKQLLQLIHPDDRPLVKREIIGKIKNLQGKQFDFRILTSKQQTIYARMLIFSQKHKPTNSQIVEGVLQNITHEKLHELEMQSKNMQLRASNLSIIERAKELEIAKQKAEENDRLKTAFLSNLTHEIRTPISSISGFAELLLSDKIEKKKKENYLNIILQSNKHLLQIFTDMIYLSKINSNQLKIENTETDIEDLVDELSNDVAQLIKQRKLKFKFIKATKPEKNKAIIDAAKTKKILSAILDNAIKFTTSGCITISFDLDNHQLTFSITDTGSGIAQEKLASVFEPFRQGDDTLTRTSGGTGLGLAIVQGLVNVLSGKITIDSIQGKGTKIVLSIPTAQSVIEQ